MDLEELSLKTTSLLRKAGIADVSRPVLVGAAIIACLLICIAIWQFWPRPSDSFATATTTSASSNTTAQNAEMTSEVSKKASTILVDIEGAVVNPGLYELEEGARAGDAIKEAGGFTQDASNGAINLAQKLNDGEQLRIPTVDEQEQEAAVPATGNTSASPQNKEGKININTATAEELQKLSGIGPSLSERIIDYRETNGKFSSIEELQKVSGIGETRFNNFKDKICI